MANFHSKIESKPGVVFLSQIVVVQEKNGNSKAALPEVTKSIAEWGFNFALPLLCLTDEEDKYHLLTGLAIYESAVASGIDKIWAILIVAKKPEAERAVQQALLQSKLNDWIIEPQDIADFLQFLNNVQSPLTSIRGIGEKYANKIVANRPYTCQEDMHKKLGFKQPLNWLRAYKETF